ncbi:MAG: AbrB/MazE/SpoVT family DNA-binding domain-containing protein [Pirellulaceae bacterium]|nr:AbrB/MazE/SpoVT family DNA-binding domain-containing protein [Pirellulaceae bacterium]
MKTVEVHTCGSEQTINLPLDCHIDATEVFVKRVGRSLLLIPGDIDAWQLFSQGLEGFTDDFMSDRSQPAEQERRGVFE